MPTDRTAVRSAELSAAIEDLVDANHILADQGTVDGFGHVSVRHPTNPTRYLLSKNVAPEVVTKDDIIEFDLDSVPLDAKGRALYLERFIHGEIYKARPDAMKADQTMQRVDQRPWNLWKSKVKAKSQASSRAAQPRLRRGGR